MSSQGWIPIRYRVFYDVPRTIVARRAERLYLLESRFDDARDEFRDEYVVYVLPLECEARLDADVDWIELASCGQEIGSVKVADVVFDETRRKAIAETVFRALGL